MTSGPRTPSMPSAWRRIHTYLLFATACTARYRHSASRPPGRNVRPAPHAVLIANCLFMTAALVTSRATTSAAAGRCSCSRPSRRASGPARRAGPSPHRGRAHRASPRRGHQRHEPPACIGNASSRAEVLRTSSPRPMDARRRHAARRYRPIAPWTPYRNPPRNPDPSGVGFEPRRRHPT